jgi:hypothetical protein
VDASIEAPGDVAGDVPVDVGVPDSSSVTEPGGDAPAGGGTGSATGGSRFEVLPPVGHRDHPAGPSDVIVQVSVDRAGLAIPLLTVYGGLRAVAITDDGWRTGTVTDFMVQQFLDEADGVGLLDEPLVLRGPDIDSPPQITVRLRADGHDLLHEFDLSRIDRPPALRIFLHRWTATNRYQLDEPFDPTEWIACDAPAAQSVEPTCRVADRQISPSDRPLLPHESDATALLP